MFSCHFSLMLVSCCSLIVSSVVESHCCELQVYHSVIFPVGKTPQFCKYTLQYRSKVSYHPSYRFSRDESLVSRDESLVSRDETLVARDETLVSRDETLVSREPLKRIFWNTLQAFSLRDNNEFLATR